MNTKDMLRAACDDIELITGIKTVIYDENRKMIHSQPDLMCDFCREVRRSRRLTEKCLACDAHGFSASAQGGDICIYHCHMGLVEAVAPVTENGRTVGYLMLGQLLPENGRERVRKQIDLLGAEVDRAALYAHLDAMPETDEKHLRATARILAMSAAYVRVHEWMREQKNTAAYQIERYVFENLTNEALTARTVGAAMGFSRTALYNACMKGFGMGAGDYIRKVRADRAIRLLRTTALPLAHVAEQVGVGTPARLTRLLKAQTGMTAKDARRQENRRE